MTTADTKAWQQVLISQGFLPKGSDDGSFGPKTTEATKVYQTILQKIGIYKGAIDGLVGPGTLSADAVYRKVAPVHIDPSKKQIGSVAGIPIYREGNTISYTAGLQIDGDGCPRCYAPAGSGLPALDFLGNAGGPGNWWGVVTDTGKSSGKPVIQKANHPYPGYYVSATSLENPAFERTDPRKYVDSELVPFFVLPAQTFRQWGISLGDPGIVTNIQTGKSVKAIYADNGPAHKLGEGSIALAKALGIPSSPRNGGTSSKIVKVEIPVK